MKTAIRRFTGNNIKEIALFFFILFCGVMIQARNERFLTSDNIGNLLINTSIAAILAAGMMMVIITRGIDLSIAANLATSGMVSALYVSNYPDSSVWAALGIGTAVGLVFGVLSGFLVGYIHVPPIIATMGMMNILRGLVFIITWGKWVSAYQLSASYKELATGKIFGVNKLILLAIIINILVFYFLTYTKTGRKIYATGSNPESAKISGIRTERIHLLVYTIMGGLSGLCGVLWVSKFATAQGDTAQGLEMSVIAACVLGGVSITGGSGKVAGVVLGAVFLGMMNNSLTIVHISPFWQNAIQGIIILLAILLNASVNKKMSQHSLAGRRAA